MTFTGCALRRHRCKDVLNLESFLGSPRRSPILWDHHPFSVPDVPRARSADVLQLQLVAPPGTINSSYNAVPRLLLLTSDTEGDRF